MKVRQVCSRENSQTAFTLTDLLVVISVVALMAGLALPALAHAKIKSPAAGCISNLRQMMIGWAMYKEDNNDVMMPNAPFGYPDNETWCGTRQMSWNNAIGNTNQAYLASSLMARYVANDIRVFKCPADVLPSDNGQRLRSYSMNGQMGALYFQGSAVSKEDSGAQYYVKGNDLTCLSPASAIIFADENAYTLLDSVSDGYLEVSTMTPGFPDAPAYWHGGACGFSFADGHAEIHKWQTSVLTSLPYAYGVTTGGGAWAALCSSSNEDWVWFAQHTACKSNGTLSP